MSKTEQSSAEISHVQCPSMTSSEELVNETVRAVSEFKGDKLQEDDITVLALTFHGAQSRAPTVVLSTVAKNMHSEIDRINEAFEAFAEAQGIDFAVAMKMNLIFDELLNNIMSHAYSDDDIHEIEVRSELAGNRLTVTISDDGEPFNPLNVETPDATLSAEDREVGGLGIHLVRNLIDKISYQRRIERNMVTLVKIL